MKRSQPIASTFNRDYLGTPPRVQRTKKPRIIHASRDECTFTGRGTTHTCITTLPTGERYLDRTRVQRCACGEKLITRISRTEVPS